MITCVICGSGYKSKNKKDNKLICGCIICDKGTEPNKLLTVGYKKIKSDMCSNSLKKKLYDKLGIKYDEIN